MREKKGCPITKLTALARGKKLILRGWPGVACAQTSAPFRNANIKKILSTKSCVHLRKFIIASAVAVLGISLSCKMAKMTKKL